MPFLRQRLVVLLFCFVNHHVAAAIRKAKGNAQQILKSLAQRLSAFRRDEKQHETAAARSEKFAPERPGAASSLIDLIEIAFVMFPVSVLFSCQDSCSK